MARPVAGRREVGPSAALASGCCVRPRCFEPCDEIVELQLFETLADRIQLGGRVLDQLAPLPDELERLAEAGLVRVEAADDRLESLDRGLVGALLSRHLAPSLARGSAGRAHPREPAPARLRRPASGRT